MQHTVRGSSEATDPDTVLWIGVQLASFVTARVDSVWNVPDVWIAMGMQADVNGVPCAVKQSPLASLARISPPKHWLVGAAQLQLEQARPSAIPWYMTCLTE